jgi:hypothetical protein
MNRAKRSESESDYGYDEDEPISPPVLKKQKKAKKEGAKGGSPKPPSLGRARPTNNQLL